MENCPQLDQKHSGGPCSRNHISRTQAWIPTILEPCKSRKHKLSDGTKNVKIRHRKLGQIRARTRTRFKKKRAGNETCFSSRIAAFARSVFPTRCIGKITTLAMTCNSRFAGSIPRLTGVFAGKTHKNNSGTPTSRSHNSVVRTPIRENFIPLESRRQGLSEDMMHDPF